MFRTVKELVKLAELHSTSISEIMIEHEMERQERSYNSIFSEMEKT